MITDPDRANRTYFIGVARNLGHHFRVCVKWRITAGYEDIPLDCLRAKGLDSFFCAGCVIGADDMVFGSIRVMGKAFAAGEAAGCAASNSF